MADEESCENASSNSSEMSSKDVTRGALFLAGVTVASILGGFGFSVGMARRKSPDAFSKTHNEATQLALKALGWGTVFAVGGVGLVVLGVKTALGVKDVSLCGPMSSVDQLL